MSPRSMRPHGLGVAAVVALVGVLALACSSSSKNPTPAPPASACGDGYLAAVNGACPTGTCLEPEAGAACCGSQCASCEDKGLVSPEDGGACPEGTCLSTDLTVALSCCDPCPGDDASTEGGGSEASVEAGVGAGDALAGDAAGD